MMQLNPIQNSPRSQQLKSGLQATLDIVGGTHFGRYPKISTESTYNMSVSDNCLVDLAGYTAETVISQNGFAREIYNSVFANMLFVVMGDGLFTVTANGTIPNVFYTVTRVGTLATSSGYAYMADNLAGQVAIVD